MNYKYYFKPMVDVKDAMLFASGGKAVESSEWITDEFDRKHYIVKTEIDLERDKFEIIEDYHYNYSDATNLSGVVFTLSRTGLDDKKSYISLCMNFCSSFTREEIEFYNLEKRGFFGMFKPKELLPIYRSWFHFRLSNIS